MSYSDDAIALLRAVLRNNCSTDLAARKYLSDAAVLGVDPLDYCAHRFGLGCGLVWRRAAAWSGYAFADELPSHARLPRPKIDHLDRLGEMRSLRWPVLGQDLTFIAPRFAQVLNLRRARTADLAARLRFAPPEAIEAAVARAASGQLLTNAQEQTRVVWPDAAAADLLPGTRLAFFAIIVLLILLVFAAGSIAQHILVPLVAVLLIAPGLLRLLAALPREPTGPEAPMLSDAELPDYSVLIPLRDETDMVPQLVRAMSALDYPPERIEIRFVVESKSRETVAAVQAHLADPRFRMTVVPEAAPATKPKAIDYALPLARGRYLVVYDAEDVPEPDQLRRAASRFEADPMVACLQAELIPENAGENVLTALFAGEYAALFGRLLPALSRWGLPVPLGGTSNHFRIEVLRELGGWDAYNVTEDADLGVRLRRGGFKAEMLDSRTLEEAPVDLAAWMAQRTRWMKGWMQTYLVHARSPLTLLREVGGKAFVGFHVLVGGMILTALLHTIFLGSLLARLWFEGWTGFIPGDAWDWLSIGVLIVGYGGAIVITFSGVLRLKPLHPLVLAVQFALPAYWVLHSIAAGRAAWQLIFNPTYWAKTTHGVTRISRSGVVQAGQPSLEPRTGRQKSAAASSRDGEK